MNSLLFVSAASAFILLLTYWISRQLRREEENQEVLRVRERSLEESQRLANIGHFERDIQTGAFVWADNMYKIHGVTPDTFLPGRETFLELVADDVRGMVGDRVHHLDNPPTAVISSARSGVHPTVRFATSSTTGRLSRIGKGNR